VELLGSTIAVEHQAGATICMVTHDPRYARLAERIVHLFDGRVEDGVIATAARRM
jgi:putative ABC transport system ATP-binding protein